MTASFGISSPSGITVSTVISCAYCDMQEQIEELLVARRGHFELESGHHGDLWLDLELLFLQPRRIEPLAGQLAAMLSTLQLDAVCGPLVEGAFVGMLVASALDLPFLYTEAFSQHSEGLFPVGYRLPPALEAEARGRRIAIVNDVINAGSAVRGTVHALHSAGGKPVAVGALALLGPAFEPFAREHELRLLTLARLPNQLWRPADCPLCASGVPLTRRDTSVG